MWGKKVKKGLHTNYTKLKNYTNVINYANNFLHKRTKYKHIKISSFEIGTQ